MLLGGLPSDDFAIEQANVLDAPENRRSRQPWRSGAIG
jgi:hypothetical protein